MFSAVFRCFSWVITFMDNHPSEWCITTPCAHFVELSLRSGESLAGTGCFGRKSNWTKFDHSGSTGGHWETISGSFSIPFGNGLEVPSQYPAVSRRRGDCSKDPHQLVQICAESKVDHLCRSTGRPELEGQLSVFVSQYRQLLSTCIVRAQTQSILSRVGVISPHVREAA